MVPKTRFFGVFCLLALASFGGVFLPQTSEEYMRFRPMGAGEAAFVPDGVEATVYLGTGAASPRRVSDPSSLRGSRTLVLGQGDFAVSADSRWTHDASANTYTASQTGAVIIVSVPSVYELVSISCTYHANGGSGLEPDQPHVSSRYEGNVCIFTLDKIVGSSVTVTGFGVKVKAFGDGDGVNDLTETTFMLKDTIGMIDFANLREHLYHKHDGNRGQDWAKYAASNTVHIAGHRVVYDDRGRYSTRVTNTNLVFDAGGYSAITISFRGASASVDGFRVTEYAITNGTHYFRYTIDVDGFDPAKIGVKYTDDLADGGWIHLEDDEFAVNGFLVTVPNQSGDTGFYRLTYGSDETQTVTVTLHGHVVVKDALYLYGSGTDTNQLYQIKVTNGTLSAVPANLE